MKSVKFKDASEIRHAYIVCSVNAGEREKIAMDIAKAAVCKAESQVPCGVCPACIKADNASHPDIRTIHKGEAKAKNEISVDQVRDIVLDAVVLPNESVRKAYIFADGDAMKPVAQNAALKLLEEPPEGVVLVLCASRPENFLQTVRSRCVEIICNGSESAQDENGQMSELAEEYIRLVAKKDPFELFRFCEDNNGISLQEMNAFVSSVAQQLTDMLCGRKDSLEMPPERIMDVERLMEKCADYLRVNVNVKALFGMLEVDSIPRTRRN